MKINIVEIPEKATDQMVTLLHSVLELALGQAAERMEFTYGDVMSACLHIVVEAGLEGVSGEELRKDVIGAFDLTLEDCRKRRREASN